MKRKILVLVLEVRVLESTVSRGIWTGWEGSSEAGLVGREDLGGTDMEEGYGESKGAPELRQVLEETAGGRGCPRWAGSVSGGPHAPVPSSAPRQKHVATLLDIRGLRHTAARQEILAVTRDLELCEVAALSPPRDRAFFADIPVPRPPICLSLPLFLGRLTLSRLACLPWPRPPAPSPLRRPQARR